MLYRENHSKGRIQTFSLCLVNTLKETQCIKGSPVLVFDFRFGPWTEVLGTRIGDKK